MSTRIALLLGLLAACGGKSAPNSKPADGLACTIDESCRPPPCGPCESGTVITRATLDQTCTLNPCKQPAAVCGPAHVCVVK
ncbi:MAG: hypothetical protein ABI867_32300 [Kofleriaceae bacterium]